MFKRLNKEEISIIKGIFGFSESESRVFAEIVGMPKSLSAIARHAKIPRGSIHYIVKKFEKRGIASAAPDLSGGKNLRWRSDIRLIVRKLNAIIQGNNSRK
ncbi:MAG TPA: helix-turn-helix domain-containing protein [Candidatus Paceibacterota bacterium]